MHMKFARKHIVSHNLEFGGGGVDPYVVYILLSVRTFVRVLE
jgi:hypothetical protein